MLTGLSVCLSVCQYVCLRNSKTIAPIDFYTRSIIPVARSSSKITGLGSASGHKNLLKDSSPLRDRTKYAIRVRHNVIRAVPKKKRYGVTCAS